MYLIKYLPVLIFLILVCTEKSVCNYVDCHPLCGVTVWWRAGVCQQNGRCLCRWGWTGPRAVYVNVGKLKNFILADYCINPCHFTHDYRNPECGGTDVIPTTTTVTADSTRTSQTTVTDVPTATSKPSSLTTSATFKTSSPRASVATTSAVTVTSLTSTSVTMTSIATVPKITTQNATTKIILTVTPKLNETPTVTPTVVTSASSSVTTQPNISETDITVATITPSRTSSQVTSPKTTPTLKTTNPPTTAKPTPDIN